MSSSEASALVLLGVPCMSDDTGFVSEGQGSLPRRAIAASCLSIFCSLLHGGHRLEF